MPFLSFSDNLVQDNHLIIFLSVDNFEKTCSISGWFAVPLNMYWFLFSSLHEFLTCRVSQYFDAKPAIIQLLGYPKLAIDLTQRTQNF